MVRVQVYQTILYVSDYRIGIFEGKAKRPLMINYDKSWQTEIVAIKNAKVMAKILGIPYDSRIIFRRAKGYGRF